MPDETQIPLTVHVQLLQKDIKDLKEAQRLVQKDLQETDRSLKEDIKELTDKLNAVEKTALVLETQRTETKSGNSSWQTWILFGVSIIQFVVFVYLFNR